jgi:hypothetical protein
MADTLPNATICSSSSSSSSKDGSGSISHFLSRCIGSCMHAVEHCCPLELFLQAFGSTSADKEYQQHSEQQKLTTLQLPAA